MKEAVKSLSECVRMLASALIAQSGGPESLDDEVKGYIAQAKGHMDNFGKLIEAAPGQPQAGQQRKPSEKADSDEEKRRTAFLLEHFQNDADPGVLNDFESSVHETCLGKFEQWGNISKKQLAVLVKAYERIYPGQPMK